MEGSSPYLGLVNNEENLGLPEPRSSKEEPCSAWSYTSKLGVLPGCCCCL